MGKKDNLLSTCIYCLGILLLILCFFSLVAGHPGAALRLLNFVFTTSILGFVSYIYEIIKNEKK